MSTPMFKNLIKLLHAGELTDLTIECGDQKIKVHKLVLVASSDVFRAMLTGDFKEANKDSVELHHEPEVVRAMIEYLYTNDHDSSSRGEDSKMRFAVKMYAIADYFNLSGLQEYAAREFEDVFGPGVGVDQTDFIQTLHLVETSTCATDNTLRDIAMRVVMNNTKLLLKCQAFRDYLSSHQDLNCRLLHKLANLLPAPAQHDSSIDVGSDEDFGLFD